jgi:hypothetical protein
MPLKQLISVVLPQPLRPSKYKTVPAHTVNEMPRKVGCSGV